MSLPMVVWDMTLGTLSICGLVGVWILFIILMRILIGVLSGKK